MFCWVIVFVRYRCVPRKRLIARKSECNGSASLKDFLAEIVGQLQAHAWLAHDLSHDDRKTSEGGCNRLFLSNTQ